MAPRLYVAGGRLSVISALGAVVVYANVRDAGSGPPSAPAATACAGSTPRQPIV